VADMQAVVFYAYGKPEVLKVASLPKPEAGHGQVLVRVHAAAMNPKDTFIRKGRYRFFTGRRFPQQTGFDVAGVVVEVGAQVKRFKVGDPIYAMLNGWQGGAFAEYVALPEDWAARMPKNLTFQQAAALPLAAHTALQALRDRGKVRLNEPYQHVLVNGASGGVGTMAIQIAKAWGARVTGITSERNFDLVQALGADEMVDYSQQKITQLDDKYSLFFDVFGNYAFRRIRHLLTPSGRYVTTVPKSYNLADIALTIFQSQKARLVSVKGNAADLEVITQLAESKHLRPAIDAVYPLEDIQQAYLHVESKRTRGKVVVAVLPD
jgi:NADPH:quinone reductase-like Zn-dependent oxidoreductase